MQHDQKRESWNQTKTILANEIKKEMGNIDHGIIRIFLILNFLSER